MSGPQKGRLHGALVTGAAEIRLDSQTVRRHAVDGVAPSAVVWPKSEEELSHWLREAHRQRAKVMAQGAGELLHIGGVPEPFDLVICTAELREVLDFDAENLTVSVQAGMPLAALQRLVAQGGLRLPVDPPVSGQATVGGLVAANAYGPTRLLYGGLRDLLLGCSVALADGTIIKSGGKTVKNVAGYDLCKLFVGSFGSLGLLTRVTLRLLPVAGAARAVLASFASRSECCRAAAQMVQSSLCPAAVEVLNPGAVAWLGVFDEPTGADLYMLVVLFEGKREVVGAVAHQAAAELTTAFGSRPWELKARGLAKLRQELNALLRGEPEVLQVRANVPMSKVESTCGELEDRVKQAGYRAEIVGHQGLGVVLANVPVTPTEEPRVAEQLVGLRPQLADWGGSLVLTRATPHTKRQVDVWGAGEDTLHLMRGIKKQFDPRGVFAVGRFVGGL